MRSSNPLVEKDFGSRLLNRPVAERLLEVFKHPVYSLCLLRDRWYECRHEDYPMLAPKANVFLERNISSHHIGFEWGSGGSTIWFARHCRSLISIEHSSQWHAHVAQRLQGRGLSNVDYRLIVLDHDSSVPTHAQYSNVPQYVAQISAFADQSFDFCLVDGHYRQACIRAALPKIKLGGLLILDDSHRISVAQWGVPESWDIALQHHTGVKATTIWRASE